MLYSKTFKNRRFEQIVVMRRQDKDGGPEVRLYFKPDGMGVCEFGIGLECEARHLLGYSLSKRRLALKERLQHRGEKGVQNLKDVMMELWDARKR